MTPLPLQPIAAFCAGEDKSALVNVEPWIAKVWWSAAHSVVVFETLTQVSAHDGCEGDEHYAVLQIPRDQH